MARFVGIFCALWFGFAAFFVVFALARPATALFALLGAGMFALGYGLAAFASHIDRVRTTVLLAWLADAMADPAGERPEFHPTRSRSGGWSPPQSDGHFQLAIELPN